ncbi:MAG: hypothetical protein CMC31_00485 [Flavobacteriaceae bacterium]|nr:hypothetical protein [Flavobacteriaceae bacterium]|tara:strand:+ start:3493 stop:3945 length:453 start_codon:yes stop_codon:yes gene_type:complete
MEVSKCIYINSLSKRLIKVGIIFITILITSCATPTNNISQQLETSTEQRISICRSKNIDGYIGNCIIELIENDKYHSEFMTNYVAWKDWYILKEANKNLLEQYESDIINSIEANKNFNDSYKLFVDELNKSWKQRTTKQEAKNSKELDIT